MGARVLIVGGGGREHALCWKLARSPSVSELLVAPGNAGIAQQARCLPVAAEDVSAIAALAVREGVDLVVIGPEAPLCAGLADVLADRGVPAFGPGRAGAELEGSKAFAKRLMRGAGVPTADFAVVDSIAAAETYIADHPGPMVVKADGLAAGKGVVVADSAEQALAAARRMLVEGEFGAAGSRLVLEERLSGRECSIMALCDGERLVLLPSVEDHKPALDGDRGPNTGGMGTYSPSPLVDDQLAVRVRDQILRRVVDALFEMGRPYRGLLYAGLMLTPDRGPHVLEFNCRFGDPETQAALVRLEDDLYPWLYGAALGRLPMGAPRVDSRASVCVVQCAGGYPGPYHKGAEIQGIAQAEALPDVTVFHAGTALHEGRLVTAGGRVLGVTALGDDLAAARARAYQAVNHIHWRDEHHRTDIAARSS
jgi:phosphoribosylamine--glycine ligase